MYILIALKYFRQHIALRKHVCAPNDGFSSVSQRGGIIHKASGISHGPDGIEFPPIYAAGQLIDQDPTFVNEMATRAFGRLISRFSTYDFEDTPNFLPLPDPLENIVGLVENVLRHKVH